jgi:hypothetical protein
MRLRGRHKGNQLKRRSALILDTSCQFFVRPMILVSAIARQSY